MKLSFAHIVLNVTDIKRSRIFYQNLLKGFRVIDEGDHHVGLSNGEFSVWLSDADPNYVRYEGVATDQSLGLHHFAFKVDTIEELQEWEKHLISNGVKLSKDGITDDDFGGTGLFFRDPDNIRLEIHLK